MRSLHLCLVGFAIGVVAAPANAGIEQGWFVFAENQIERFNLQARTGWVANDTPPTVNEVECTGDNESMMFTVNQAGGIQHISNQFIAGLDSRGRPRRGAYLGDVLWLNVDGDRYELRNIKTPDRRFTNFPYAPFDPGDQEIILVWSGTTSVRQSEAEPFRPISSIYEQIVKAKKIEWSMKVADPNIERDPDFSPGRRYRIDSSGLRSAVAWCRHQVAAPAARMLPADLLKKMTGS